MGKLAFAVLSLVVLLSFVIPSRPIPVLASGPVLSEPSPSQVRLAAVEAGLDALSAAPVPEANLGEFLNAGPAARVAAIQLGKAFFWDSQSGSDGQACASCHFQAGADGRVKNQLNPGFRRVSPSNVFNTTRSGDEAGPNYTLTPADFPFHDLQDPNELNFNKRVVLSDTDDVVSSQGVFAARFAGTTPGRAHDDGVPIEAPVFKVGNPPINVRHAAPRNAPSVINAVFNFANFWDGRANNEFNGVSPLGYLDPDARILVVSPDGILESVPVRIRNSSLASQAVGPPLSNLEMSFEGRTFPDLGKKLLDPALIPLAGQAVHADDSVLGGLRAENGGLGTSYSALVRQAFQSKYWSSEVRKNGYTQMESNFGLFWGLAIQMYETTLVSDQTPFDRFMSGDDAALAPAQLEGLLIFINAPNRTEPVFRGLSQGGCSSCHSGPELTEASASMVAQEAIEIHQTVVSNNGLLEVGADTAYTDTGFSNIGVRPTADDLGRGGNENGKPLSFTRQAFQGISLISMPYPEPGRVALAIPPDNRIAIDGAFKVPSLRNVELTGPYFHNGGQATLQEVISFYSRDGDFSDVNVQDVDPFLVMVKIKPEDEEPLVQFMLSLTDERVRLEQAPFDHPELFVPNGHPGTETAIAHTNPAEPIQAADDLLELPAVGASGRPGIGLGPLVPFMSVPLQVSLSAAAQPSATGTSSARTLAIAGAGVLAIIIAAVLLIRRRGHAQV